uniref:Uncharacterized protein n=1 Tax=Siphoviridae sp. ctC6Q17 TaxID=2827271 RepID=A0A8S5R3H6_9CAUD|nr:MAG TPA: hypothetical protein [Siphoviridae sp. ctC6Q17]
MKTLVYPCTRNFVVESVRDFFVLFNFPSYSPIS